jgi:hypothetical protein
VINRSVAGSKPADRMVDGPRRSKINAASIARNFFRVVTGSILSTSYNRTLRVIIGHYAQNESQLSAIDHIYYLQSLAADMYTEKLPYIWHFIAT